MLVFAYHCLQEMKPTRRKSAAKESQKMTSTQNKRRKTSAAAAAAASNVSNEDDNLGEGTSAGTLSNQDDNNIAQQSKSNNDNVGNLSIGQLKDIIAEMVVGGKNGQSSGTEIGDSGVQRSVSSHLDPSTAGKDDESHDTISNEGSENADSEIGSDSNTDDEKTVNFESSGVPLDAYLDNKIKGKILAGQFVEYRSLLSKNAPNDKSKKFRISENGGEKLMLSFAGKMHDDSSLRLSEWHKAHAIFSTVSIRHHKDYQLAIDLIKYGTLISRMADLGGDWANYDRNFRKMMAQASGSSARSKWSRPNWELWHSMVNSKKSGGVSSGTSSRTPQSYAKNYQRSDKTGNGKRRIPEGFCFHYHRGAQCFRKPCQFSHSCPECSGAHALYQCQPGKVKQTTPMQKTSTSNSG